jgi:hypothetical protein
MATAREFVARIDAIDGVSGCLLVRDDGVLLGQTLDDPEVFSTLLVISNNLSREVMEKVGFSYCQHVSFSRSSKRNFYLFPIDRYLLGVVQRTDSYVPDMLEAVYRLIGRVTTGNSAGGTSGD